MLFHFLLQHRSFYDVMKAGIAFSFSNPLCSIIYFRGGRGAMTSLFCLSISFRLKSSSSNIKNFMKKKILQKRYKNNQNNNFKLWLFFDLFSNHPPLHQKNPNFHQSGFLINFVKINNNVNNHFCLEFFCIFIEFSFFLVAVIYFSKIVWKLSSF